MAEKKPLILAVDDEPEVLRLYKRVLESAGYEVITASDGKQALLLAAERSPGVVLLDIRMPGKSGLEVLKELKNRHSDIAVIMATGLGDVTNAIQCMRKGAFDYLVKPISLDEIVLSVDRAWENRRLVLENRAYQLNLEKKVAEQTEHLERRITELTALNSLFQEHLNQRFNTEQAYRRLAEGIVRIAEELQELIRQSEKQMPPSLNHP